MTTLVHIFAILGAWLSLSLLLAGAWCALRTVERRRDAAAWRRWSRG